VAVAQLVELLVVVQAVAGSNPVSHPSPFVKVLDALGAPSPAQVSKFLLLGSVLGSALLNVVMLVRWLQEVNGLDEN
jgi:hypothetical protein